jgi:hypothetical protein
MSIDTRDVESTALAGTIGALGSRERRVLEQRCYILNR